MKICPFISKKCIIYIHYYSKVDSKKRLVDETEGRLWADSRGFYYFETSAQTGDGVGEMFQVGYILYVCMYVWGFFLVFWTKRLLHPIVCTRYLCGIYLTFFKFIVC